MRDLSLLGLVDNHGAGVDESVETDVKRLDSLCWRALKNQTTSSQNLGQNHGSTFDELQTDRYHIGGLHNHVAVR